VRAAARTHLSHRRLTTRSAIDQRWIKTTAHSPSAGRMNADKGNVAKANVGNAGTKAIATE
jgi:hypothetical protein